MVKIPDIIEHIKHELRRYYLSEMEGEPWPRRAFYTVVCFVNIFITEVNNLRLFTRIASGTYTTMLALIPFMIVGGSLIITFNKEANIPELITRINEFVIPVAGNTIAGFLTESLTRTLDLGLGPVGVISLLVTSVMLFVHIEDAFNDIWHVVKPRAFYLRILLFYAIVTLGPLLISFSMFQAASIIPEELTSGVFLRFLWETLFMTGFCFIIFKFLPNTRVQLKYALIPAVVSAIAIEIAKFGFSIYLSLSFKSGATNTILYGALGIIPAVLLWLYLTWMMVLFGVEAGYCMQNMRSLKLRKCYERSSDKGDDWVFIGAYAALEVLAALARNLCAGKGPMKSEELAVECIYPITAIEAILGRLEGMGIIRRLESEFATEYVFARPMDSIALCDVMKAFDESSPRVKKHPRLDALVEQLLAAQDNIWKNCNVNMLREDGVALKDVGELPTVTDLHVD
ncbi:MAG: YihY/virulence factor BrkB family protein [Proteobacteria bacterium]|nr:YihY/virulence factor BrkB family protein [Pseudomonadota bacterium]